MGMCVVSFFFFFKQKTAYEMRISDWSSDVCSSDLEDGNRGAGGQGQCAGEDQEAERGVHRRVLGSGRVAALLARVAMVGCGGPLAVVRRDWKSVVEGRSGSGSGDIGGPRILKKQIHTDIDNYQYTK